MSPLPSPKAIIFDWDNTLVDTWSIIHQATNATLLHFDMETWSLEYVRHNVRQSMRDRFPTIFGDKWEEAAKVFYEQYDAIHLAELRALEHAEEMLQTLHNEGIHLSIVSNKRGDYLRLEAEQLKWGAYLSNLVGSGDTVRDKPAIDPVHLALNESGFTPGPAIWFVGDTDIDMECGLNAGCTPVLIHPEKSNNGEFDTFSPAKWVKNCKEFKELVQNSIV